MLSHTTKIFKVCCGVFGFFYSLLVKSSVPKSIQSPEAVSPTKVWLETRCKGNRLGLLGILLECLP